MFGFIVPRFLCVALIILELTVDQVSLELRGLPVSAPQILGLKATIPS